MKENILSFVDGVRTAGKQVDENPMVATDDFDEPLLAAPGASSHSNHRFE